MSDYLKRGARGLAAVFVLSFLGNVAGYLTRTFLARVLDPADFGLFYSIFSLSMFLVLFGGLGFGAAIPKYLSELLAKKDTIHLRRLVTWSTGLRMGVALLGGLAVYLSSGWLAVNYYRTPQALPVLTIFAIVIPLLLFARILHNLLQGYQFLGWMGILGFAEKFFFLVAVLALWMLGIPPKTMLAAWGYLLAIAATVLIFLPLTLRITRLFKEKAQRLPRMFRRAVIWFAMASVLTALGELVIGYIDTMILTYFAPLAEVGIYNTVLPTMVVLAIFTKTIQGVFFPMSSELWAKGEKKRLRDGIALLERWTLFVVVPIALTTSIFPETVLGILFGSKYVSGATAMRLLSPGIVVFTVSSIYSAVLSGIGAPQLVTLIVGLASLTNIVLNFIFIPSFGMQGAAATTSVSYAVMLVAGFLALRRRIPLPIRWGMLGKMLLAGLVCAAGLLGVRTWYPRGGILELVTAILVAGILYITSILLLKVITKEETLRLLGTLRPSGSKKSQ